MSKVEVIVKKFSIEDGRYRFLIGKGGVGVQLSQDEARSLAIKLGLLCGIGVAFTGLDIKMHRMNANENSTKGKPLGGDDTEEHL